MVIFSKVPAHKNQKQKQLLGSLDWLYAIQNWDFCSMMWTICMGNLFLNPENKTCAYLLLVGPVAKTSDCSFGKNPCSYFPWPIFISSRWGWMAVWSIFISRCSMDWAAGDTHRWATSQPARGHALSQQQCSCSHPWKPSRVKQWPQTQKSATHRGEDTLVL